MKLLSSAAIRRCIAAEPGCAIISADYDQVELRIAAAFSGEPSMIEAARRGESLHNSAAIRLWGPNYTPDQYRYTKNVNFGWLFGGGATTLAEQAGIPFDEARAILAEYGAAFPRLRDWKRREQRALIQSALPPNQYEAYQRLLSQMFEYDERNVLGARHRAAIRRQLDQITAHKLGYVTLPSGRRLPVELSKSYKVINYKVQGHARDVMAAGLLRVMAIEELAPTVLLPIHDELLGHVPEDRAAYFARRYGKVMSTKFMGVPLTAEGKVYGKSWGHGYGA